MKTIQLLTVIFVMLICGKGSAQQIRETPSKYPPLYIINGVKPLRANTSLKRTPPSPSTRDTNLISLILTLDRPYPFVIFFYHAEQSPEILCLILRSDGQFMLLKKDKDSGLWQRASGNNTDAAFEQGILESAKNLIPCMLAVTAVRPWQELSAKFR